MPHRQALAACVLVATAIRAHLRGSGPEMLAFWTACYVFKDRLLALALQLATLLCCGRAPGAPHAAEWASVRLGLSLIHI